MKGNIYVGTICVESNEKKWYTIFKHMIHSKIDIAVRFGVRLGFRVSLARTSVCGCVCVGVLRNTGVHLYTCYVSVILIAWEVERNWG